MTRPRYQPAIFPHDPEEALDRLYMAVLKTDLPPIERLWLRNALQARRNGLARSIDEALGLGPPLSPAKLAQRRRRGYLQKLFLALQPCTRWHGATQIALMMIGAVEPPVAAVDACAALRADPFRPRIPRSILRHLTDRSDPNSCQ